MAPLWLTTSLSGEPELELTILSGELVLALTTSAGYTTKIFYREWENFFLDNIYVLFQHILK